MQSFLRNNTRFNWKINPAQFDKDSKYGIPVGDIISCAFEVMSAGTIMPSDGRILACRSGSIGIE
jgi:hypothetical protein